ncbi:tRNA lysidine(34) synthetase TilS [Aquihabitans sp. G128]|uniref:tRNA lysidine(34) synthetase TilS n=1 Tax=Aquihabitans sp. G128 TaxID=2849779 RepID=UPI001C2404D8|nr:tRNA lysidine(34) synthetase TilS [Aquihabitans sp. G128]QXC59277.1 tRNA lysidine(34) synthetase TilS [Aquihabitans sp. G128]
MSSPVEPRTSGTLDLGAPLVAALAARCPFPPPGTPVTVAVSGGADSLALLVLAVAAGCEVVAVHVDHGIRAGSAAEAEVVADVAGRLGAGFRAEQVVVAPGPNLEARARAARYGVLPADVLTGHTADDRAETVLLNLARGAGPAGMAGIRRSPRRPLVDVRRQETEALCAALGLLPVQDPSNLDPAFLRNRVRHELLPLLADLGRRDPVPLLVRQAELFAEVDDALVALAVLVDPTSAADLRAAARPVAGAAIRAWLLAAGVGDGHPAEAAAVDRVLAVAAGDAVACQVAGGWRVARTAGRLRLEPPDRPA